MLLHALCIPDVSNGDHADTVRSLYGNGFLHKLGKRAVGLVKAFEKQILVHRL